MAIWLPFLIIIAVEVVNSHHEKKKTYEAEKENRNKEFGSHLVALQPAVHENTIKSIK